jgi:hypothetical protein
MRLFIFHRKSEKPERNSWLKQVARCLFMFPFLILCLPLCYSHFFVNSQAFNKFGEAKGDVDVSTWFPLCAAERLTLYLMAGHSVRAMSARVIPRRKFRPPSVSLNFSNAFSAKSLRGFGQSRGSTCSVAYRSEKIAI